MRADSTKAENVLWQALRNKQLEGLKFKRQVPLDGYILDFVCFEAQADRRGRRRPAFGIAT